MLSRTFAYLQYLLPRYFMTALVHRIARTRVATIKNFLISRFVRLYCVDTGDVERQIPDDFASLNEFFTRELRAGARPVDADAAAIVSPADGTVSQAGRITGRSILQAKGHAYTLDDLLAIDIDAATVFDNGFFVTIYLAPYNYHRVHAPVAGELSSLHYVPGDLFSVNRATAKVIPGLFARNERVILHLKTPAGPAAVVLVGALNVGSITTPWTGELRPRKSGTVESFDLSGELSRLKKGDLLGWFNMGSTVIVVLPDSACAWREDLQAGLPLRMGETIGRFADRPA